MAKIIVSYRRSDSAAIAGRIFDRLVAHYGEGSVFMDIDNIPFGIDFRAHIRSEMLHSNLLIAVIGPAWAGAMPDGQTRLSDAADPVRVELEAALRQGIPILPLLIEGATMPSAQQLPEPLRDLAFINAAPVETGRDFRAHMDRVIRSIDALLLPREDVSPEGARPSAQPGPVASMASPPGGASSPAFGRPRRNAVAMAAIAAVLALAGIAAAIAYRQYAPPISSPPPAERVSGPLSVPAPAIPAPVPSPSAASAPVVTYRVLASVSGGLQNMRSGPAAKYPIVIPVPAGATGLAIGLCKKSEDGTRPWCSVNWQVYSGWISSCCIVDEKTGAPPRIN